MRGETKIQLFDSKTGEKVFEHVEKNMITKSLERLLSPKNEWLYGNTTNNLLGSLGEAFPIYSRMLGGLLLFDSVLPEDENQVLPSASAKAVGHAGGEYAGANPFRGTYNTTESGPLSEGYRHVWDFGTDKANGTIHSLSLTSLMGGNAGWANPTTGEGSTTPQIGSPSSYLSPSGVWGLKRMRGRALFIKSPKESGENETLAIHNGEFYRVKEANFNDLKITSSMNTFATTGYTSEFISSLPTQPHSYTYPNERIYYMDGKLHHIYSGDGAVASSTIVHDIYSLEGLRESTKTIRTVATFYGRQGPMFYFKGKYFVCPASSTFSLSVFLPDGTLEDTLSFEGLPTSADATSLQNYNGYYIAGLDKIMVVQSHWPSHSYGYFYLVDENLSVTPESIRKSTVSTASLMAPVATEDAIEPYCLLSSPSQSGTNYLYLGMWTPYLATINNLSSPVTKTNSHTMKIVYSVYNN